MYYFNGRRYCSYLYSFADCTSYKAEIRSYSGESLKFNFQRIPGCDLVDDRLIDFPHRHLCEAVRISVLIVSKRPISPLPPLLSLLLCQAPSLAAFSILPRISSDITALSVIVLSVSVLIVAPSLFIMFSIHVYHRLYYSIWRRE